MGSFCPRCISKWVWALCALAFLLSLWGGSSLFHRPAVVSTPPPPRSVVLLFDAYDTQGNMLNDAPVKAVIEGPLPFSNNTIGAGGVEQTMDANTTLEMTFIYKGQTIKEKVTWQLQSDFKQWLTAQLPSKLAALDPNYNAAKWKTISASLAGTANDIKHHYPVIFAVKP